MAPPATCENCGTAVGVSTVQVSGGRRDRIMSLCAPCKGTLLERVSVRVATKGRRRRRATSAGRLGTLLVLVGLAALLVLGALAAARVFDGDDERECYPGAGFTCETPVG